MQEELQELQPRLVQTSIETEQLIEIIEREKEEVAEIKAVVVADEAVANKAAMEAKAIKVIVSVHLYRVFVYCFSCCLSQEECTMNVGAL